MTARQDRRGRAPESQPSVWGHRAAEAIAQGGKTLVETAEDLGEELAREDLSKTQVRNIYGLVKRMEMGGFDAERFVLLKPRLAYAAARERRVGTLRDALTGAVDAVGDDERRFRRFVDFFEAILAYHRAQGGKL